MLLYRRSVKNNFCIDQQNNQLHCVKIVQIRTEYRKIRTKKKTPARKYGPEETLYLDTFHAVLVQFFVYGSTKDQKLYFVLPGSLQCFILILVFVLLLNMKSYIPARRDPSLFCTARIRLARIEIFPQANFPIWFTQAR